MLWEYEVDSESYHHFIVSVELKLKLSQINLNVINSHINMWRYLWTNPNKENFSISGWTKDFVQTKGWFWALREAVSATIGEAGERCEDPGSIPQSGRKVWIRFDGMEIAGPTLGSDSNNSGNQIRLKNYTIHLHLC